MFLRPILHTNPNARNEIFKLLIQRMPNFEDIRLLYEAMFEYTKSCYEFLYEHINDIRDMTVAHFSSRNESSVLAM